MPLSPRQRLLWADTQSPALSRVHGLVLEIVLSGPLDLRRFVRAWGQTVNDLDAFRLTIDHDHPIQWLDSSAKFDLRVQTIDPEHVDTWLAAHAIKSFEPGLFPWHACLLDAGPDLHIFCLFAHKLIIDARSCATLVEHLASRYAEVEPPSCSSFVEHVNAAAEYGESHQAAADAAFWTEYLKTEVPPLLPYGLPRVGRSAVVARVVDRVGDERARRLRALSESKPFADVPGLARAIAIATAWVAFLHRVTGNREILLGLPLIDEADGPARTCGPLTGELFVRVAIEDEDTFATLAEKIRNETERAFPHRHHSVAPRGRGFTRLQILPAFSRRFADLDASITYRPSITFSDLCTEGAESCASIGLLASDAAAEDLVIGFDFHNASFADCARTRTRNHFLRVFDAMLKEVDTPIGDVHLLDSHEQAQILLVSQGPTPPDAAEDIVARLSEQTRRSPDKIAVVAADGTLTYAELEAKSNQLARRLRSGGVENGSRVGVTLSRGSRELVSLLAVLKAGGTYVPIDPSHPAERVRVVLEDAKLQILISASDSPVHGVLPPSTARCCFDTLATLDGLDPSSLDEPLRPDQAAYILFTSGSTGRPKGVEVLRSGFANFLRSMATKPGLTANDRVLAVTTTTFDIAGLELFLPLYVGATVLIADRDTAVDPRRLRERLENDSITLMQATPATWRLLIDEDWKGDHRLRLLCGGEALRPDLAAELLKHGGELWNLYGPTETTVWSTVERIHSGDTPITIGRPIDHTQILILDAKRRPVPMGVVGEIYIGGRGLARGYFGRPDLTEERFVPDPFDLDGSGGRIYRTGDLGRLLDDGRFECLGRIDSQVKIRGFRIELAEIETTLRSFPDVKDAVVVADREGQGEARLVAYTIGSADRAALFAYASSKLPPYMVPSTFIRLPSFPLTTSGKVDRKALATAKTVAAESLPAQPPRNPREAQIAKIWAETLGIDSIGMDENLVAHGATSVLIVKARARLERELGIKLSLRTIFESPTLDDLVGRLGSSEAGAVRTFEGLWQIRSGDKGLPILLVHGDGADRFLPGYLPETQSIYGYMHQGSDGERIQLKSVESLAQRCHEEWLAVCGDQPCLILGHSYGGLVAWHLAHLRRQAGLPVALLAIIDSLHPITERRLRAPTLRTPLRWVRRLRDDRSCLSAVMKAEKYFRQHRQLPLDERNNYILCSYELSAQEYCPPDLDVDLLYFRALRTDESSADDECWRRGTRGGFQLQDIQGTHLTAVREARLFEPIGRVLTEQAAKLRANLAPGGKPMR